jgi:hypothetical protein
MRVAPPIFRPFVRYWRLSDSQARRLWVALVQARYSQPCAWRQQLLRFERTHVGTSMQLIDETSAPATVIAVIEALVHERLLRRMEATKIEERILARVTREQTWE